jgi:hypothetical protein
MHEDETRGIGLAQAMILVAALALGVVWAKEPVRRMHLNHRIPDRPVYNAAFWSRHWLTTIFPVITPLTFAIPLLSLRRPRPPVQQLFRRPGLMACVAASVALLIWGSGHLPRYAKPNGYFVGPITPWIESSRIAGYAVLGAWIALAMSGVWARRSGGLDRIGLAAGALWCSATLWGVAIELVLGWDDVRRWLQSWAAA